MRICFHAQSRSNIEPEGGRVNTRSNSGPLGIDQATRHNPRAGASAQGGCAEAKMQGWLTLNEVASRASMSTRFIRKHLSEIPHYRSSARGKIWIDWIDFQSWMRKLRVEIRQDDPVVEILRDLARKRSGAA
jgi:hypothetical protein